MLGYNNFYLSLIRHGESTINITPDVMGQPGDTPLTENGEHQARILEDYLYRNNINFNHVFSSDYKRAYDTAKLALGEDYPIVIVPELQEYDAGDWNGASRAKELTTEVQMKMGLFGNAFLPPNGESMHMVERRASKWLEDAIIYNKDIMTEAAERKAQDKKPLEIACFSHGMTIKCILHFVMGFDQNFTWRINIDNTSITKLYFGPSGWRLLSINDCSHLKNY